ncbi:hypothetical protein BDV12DRAFT_167579, partial [Aspergillus spectabilis]
MTTHPRRYLFGGPQPWSQKDWTSSDDRVRGGSSSSKLLLAPDKHTATFIGNLDINTLGGAGFASQRTTDNRNWDLSAADGLELHITVSDGKQYTLIMKDEILPERPDGRERSSLSWEAHFRVDATRGERVVRIRWDDLKSTYRGKKVDAEKPLNLKSIKRLSIMMRSFFGTQEGSFSLSIASISTLEDNLEGVKKGGVTVCTSQKEPSLYEEISRTACCVVS